MKTLKQIREEYDNKFFPQVEIPEELMLDEAKSKEIKSTNAIPSFKQMPALLLFRRVTYKMYPNKQVVALYHSKLVDKYLSIPFGPTGNLNISEAEIVEGEVLDDIKESEKPVKESFKDKIERLREERMNEGLADVADTVADIAIPYYSAGKKLYKGDYKGAAKDAAVDTAMMAVGGPLTRVAAKGLKAGAGLVRKGIGKLTGKTAEKAVARDASAIAKSAKSPKLAPKSSSPIKSAAGAAAGGAAAEVGIEAAKKVLGGGGDESANKGSFKVSGERIKDVSGPKTYSSFSKKSEYSPIQREKERQASLKENKISDLKQMIKEGIEYKDIMINGRPITLNTSMAKRIFEVYDSVNTKNKKIVEGMLNEDLESFKKLLNFSIKA